MARAGGRDVMLEMLDTVERLQRVSERHETDLQQMNVRVGMMSARMSSMAGRLDELTVRTDELTVRLNELTVRLNEFSVEVRALRESMVALSEDGTTLAGGFKRLAEGYAETRGHLSRLTRLLTEYAGFSKDRLDELETRVSKLEKKSG